MSNNYSKYKVGDVLTCTHSTSPAYKLDTNYEVCMGDFGGNSVKGLMGDDNLFDPFSMLVSTFTKADATTQALHKLKVVK